MGCELKQAAIVLFGLPGAGKQRLKQALAEQFGCEPDRIATSADVLPPEQFKNFEQAWCVIDVRSTFQTGRDDLAMQQLASLLAVSDGVIFNFTEASDLDAQAFWSRWVKQQFKDIPIVRLLNQHLSQDWCGFEPKVSGDARQMRVSALAKENKILQTYEFEVGRVCLDHLLMGLDSSRQNLGMQIWRVQAVIETFEYENLVAVEATPFRWDTFAALPDSKSGWIRVEGIDLSESWLKEIVQASLLTS